MKTKSLKCLEPNLEENKERTCLEVRKTNRITKRYLNYTATIGMGGQCGHLALESRDNKTNLFGRKTFNAFLYYVISVLVSYASHYMPIQFMHKFCFLLELNNLKSLELDHQRPGEGSAIIFTYAMTVI